MKEAQAQAASILSLILLFLIRLLGCHDLAFFIYCFSKKCFQLRGKTVVTGKRSLALNKG